jgi:hypothetical protein
MDWLETKDLCRIDSANCNHTEREHFLTLIKSENVKFDRPNDILSENYLDWITARNISIVSLKITREPKTFKKAVGLCQCLVHLKVLTVLKDTVKIRRCFQFILSNCAKLEVLHLNTCDVLDDATMKAIANNCPSLKEISFPCLEVSQKKISGNNGWVLLTEKCTKLEVLVVGNMLMSSVVLNAINKNCLNLKEFTLISDGQSRMKRHHTQITFDGVEWETPSQLRFLRLIGHLIDAGALESICKSCPLLEVFDISSCRVEIDRLTYLPLCCPLLIELNVNYCYARKIGPFVETILRGCKELCKFYVQVSYGLEQIPWFKLVSEAPNLIELSGVRMRNVHTGGLSPEYAELMQIDRLSLVSDY